MTGASFPDWDMSKIPHPPMVETMDRLKDLAKKHPGHFRFIHLNHTNPALHDEEIRRSVIERGFIAEVGESFYLW